MTILKKAVSFALAAALLAGCGTGTGGSTNASKSSTASSNEPASNNAVTEILGETPIDPSKEYFGISLPMQSSEYYKQVKDELSSYCEQFGIKYDIASADSDSTKQMQQFENFVTMGCTTIIIYAQDLASMETAMAKARKQGIRIVSATMTPSDLESYDIAVDASQMAVGTGAAEYASKWIDEKFPDAADGSVEVVLYTMSVSENVIERCDGLKKIEEINPKAKIVEVYDIPMENYLVKVKEDADLMIQTHPDVKVIMTYSDAFNLVINEDMMSSGIDPKEVCSIAVDKTAATLEQIKLSQTDESTIRCTIATGEHFNLDLIRAALGVYDDQVNDKKQYFIDPFPIDAANVDDFLN